MAPMLEDVSEMVTMIEMFVKVVCLQRSSCETYFGSRAFQERRSRRHAYRPVQDRGPHSSSQALQSSACATSAA